MKNRVFITCLFLFLIAGFSCFSQVKKVAILETVDRVGDVPYGYKAMLRANLTKAITNTVGYEAYDRTDVDQIMSEHNFQRTGMVNDDQIKRLGEVTGADYILVAEAVKVDEQNIFITAKILNVETAKTERTDNELMTMSASEIQKGCENLAAKLFVGSQLMRAQQPQTSQSVTTPPKHSEPVTPQQRAQRPVASRSDVVASRSDMPPVYEPLQMEDGVGELVTFPDNTKGVVFYVGEDFSLAVSLVESKNKWGLKNFDIQALDNDAYANTIMNSGEQNTESIVAVTSVPSAAAWCTGLGDGWYLPSNGELYYLMKIANRGEGESGPISISLVMNQGAILTGWYWSSSECNKSEAWNVSAGGRMDTEDKNESTKTRAIRAFVTK